MLSIHTVDDALYHDAMTTESAEDVSFSSFLDNTMAPYYSPLNAPTTGQVAWATDQATQPRSFQFGTENNDHPFDFALAPVMDAQWCYLADRGADGDSIDRGSAQEPSASSESISRGLLDDRHPTFFSSSDPFTFSAFPAGSFESAFSWDSLTPFISSSDIETYLPSGSESSTPPENDRSNKTDVSSSQVLTATMQNIDVIRSERTDFELHAVSDEETTQSHIAKRGWTYRQVLEIVALPPSDGLHFWHARVCQLAAKLGLPNGTTGRAVITFVIHVATVRNELDKVIPLVKAIRAAARILEGRDIVSSELLSRVIDLYPGAARAYGMMKAAGETETETGLLYTPPCDKISLAFGEERQPSISPGSEGEEGEETEETGVKEEDEPTPTKRPRPRVAERDLYCRVGACLASFKDPHVCMKHRERHFPLAWQCPGPCRTCTANRGRFARDETLKRHLLFPRYASCKNAVLRRLGLESIPTSGRGSAWLAPLRDGPERPWKRPGFRLTELETVKARLRDPNFASSPSSAVPTIARRRHK